MRADLANLNHCAVLFLSRAAVNLSWHHSIFIAQKCCAARGSALTREHPRREHPAENTPEENTPGIHKLTNPNLRENLGIPGCTSSRQARVPTRMRYIILYGKDRDREGL